MIDEIDQTCDRILQGAEQALADARTEAEVHQRKAPFIGRSGEVPRLFAKLKGN